jgi:C_GCAxxG_C_C family probable redox protein
MSTPDPAVERFKRGFNCAQAVLSASAPCLGLAEETALKLAAPFGGGMGRTGGACGAVSGALMALGLRFGSTSPDDKAAKERTYGIARRFIEEFRARNQGVLCRELLGCDIATPEGVAAARERQLFTTLCPKLVRSAAEILSAMQAEGEV